MKRVRGNMKVVKVFIVTVALLIAVCAVIKYVNLEWWQTAFKKTFVAPRKEVVEIYTYKDKKGVTVITDRPVPEDYQPEADKMGSYTRETSR
jgi:hypothetical protein